MGVSDHRELNAWKLADEVRRRVWRLTARPEFEEDPWLRRQLRQSAHSTCANIAEGFARYRPAEFARFLGIAKGSLTEVIEHLEAPVSDSTAYQRDAAEIVAIARRATGALIRLMLYLQSVPHAPGPAGSPRRPKKPTPGT
jgi:four helix bundle protein